LQLKLREVRSPEIIDKYYERYSTRPGITGWAQTNGYRGTIASYEDMYERVKHDLDYIRRRSLVLNIKILLKTLGGAFIAKSVIVDSIYGDTKKRNDTDYLSTYFEG